MRSQARDEARALGVRLGRHQFKANHAGGLLVQLEVYR